MTANVPFLKGQTVLTISGLTNADFGPETAGNIGRTSNVIRILDASGGASDNNFFGSSFTGEAGTGDWDDVNDVLRLYLLEDTESASEYTFTLNI
jgi:hypothetical protein